MPEISRFFGIVIRMFFDDHNPPHFHAEFQEHRAIIDIQSARLFDGNLPPKQLRQVQAWTLLHQQELMENLLISERNPKAITRSNRFNSYAALHQKHHTGTRLRGYMRI